MDSKLSRWCDGLIEAGWLAAVIATPLFFNIHSERVFEPDKLTLLRSIALLMSATWLVKFIDQRGWRSLEALSWRREGSVWRMPFVLPVFLLVVVYLISTAISVTPRVSWAGSYQRLQGTYTTLSYIVVFVLAIATMRTRAQVSRVVTTVIITSIPVSFYGLLQHFDLDPLPWGGDVTRRIAGHMGNAIFIAAYIIMAVPLTVARIIDAFTSILSDEELAYADVIRSSIYIFTLAIQLIAIYWSGSRGPWIGLAAAVFAFILIVLVTLRDAVSDVGGSRLGDVAKAMGLVFLGSAVLNYLISVLIGAFTDAGRAQSLIGPMGEFAAFAASLVVLVIVVFVMIAARRGWRWLWLSWLLLTLVVGGWLAAFNFSESLAGRFGGTPIVGGVASSLVSWRDLPAVGRLGKLLESESGTGKVRVLIWEGALDLLYIHEPLQFPNGEEDEFNFLRPIFGYGPESMYVAYNRFYPPELATVEARNASPDRSHNETFDALVITGGAGFLIWQALYVGVFYYGFSWLGVVRTRRDRNLLLGTWVGGAIFSSVVVTQAMGAEFFGVAVPLGSMLGLITYLVYYALSAKAESGESEETDPFQVDRLLMIGLVSAVLAHYVEIHFGIAIAATRTHFFVYVALMFIVGYWIPKAKSAPVAAGPMRGRKPRLSRGRRARANDGVWGPVLLWAMVLGLVLGILGYQFITYSLPPDKVIESVNDLTTSEIFHQSFLLNSSQDFKESPFVFLLFTLTWLLGALASVSEMVKAKELRFPSASGKLRGNRRQIAAGVFGLMLLASLGFRFLAPAPAVGSTTLLLGRSLLLIWAGLSLWAAIFLLTNHSSARLLAGSVAIAGGLFTIPILIAGGGITAAVVGAASLSILYLLWDAKWNNTLVPAATLAFVSLGIGLGYALLQASVLRSSLFFQGTNASLPVEQLRVMEAEQSSGFLTIFYSFVSVLLLLAAFASSWNWTARIRSGGSPVAFFSLVAILVVVFTAINQSNMRIIQADVIYKRAKPYDNAASRSRNPEDWNVAVSIYERAVDMVPKEDFYYLFLGRAYLEQSTVTAELADQADLLDEAEERLLNAQDINPLNTDHTANLARLNTRWFHLSTNETDKQQRLKTAESYYLDALSLSPQNSIIRNEYARLVFDLKSDCPGSLELFNESIAIDPFYAATYFGLADIYMTCVTGQSTEVQRAYLNGAAESLEAGLAINDRNVLEWMQLGEAYHKLEEYDKSVSAYEEARARSDERVPGWNVEYWMATVLLDKGDKESAEAVARQALTTAPPDAASQIQILIDQITGQPILTDRPLANLEPEARNAHYSQYPPVLIDTNKSYEAVMVTEKGEMRFRLFDDEAVLTVNNFVFLANQGFYDGITFHRVIQGFMAQGGDPTGTGGGGPGYQFVDETANGLSFDRPGLLAMANAGPNTNGSQFFITFVATPHLNGLHTIFGELVAGEEVLGSISLRDPASTEPGDTIGRIEIIESAP
jgi:cyclophilin family peptidyl-prolyl cis-trans isomerase